MILLCQLVEFAPRCKYLLHLVAYFLPADQIDRSDLTLIIKQIIDSNKKIYIFICDDRNSVSLKSPFIAYVFFSLYI